MEERTRSNLVDALDECKDEVIGVARILEALAVDLDEQEALGVLSSDLREVAGKLDGVLIALDPAGHGQELE